MTVAAEGVRDALEVRRWCNWRRGGNGDVGLDARRESVMRVRVSNAGIAVDVAMDNNELPTVSLGEISVIPSLTAERSVTLSDVVVLLGKGPRISRIVAVLKPALLPI
jgi:hypothetical protein